jgi:DNA replication licensing factor MCM7
MHANPALQVWQTSGEGTRLVFIEAGNEDMGMDDDDDF